MRYLATLLLVCASMLSAQTTPSKPADTNSKPTEINPLSRRVWEIGPFFQGGTGLGTASEFKFLVAGARVGRVLTGTIGTGRFRGTFEWAADLMPLYEVRQDDNYINGTQRWVYGGSFSPVILKWNWVGGKAVTPYFDAEGGVLFTHREVPAGDTSAVNFTPGGAFGIYIRQGPKHAFDLAVHVIHISNASLAHNPGINATMQFRVGYTWFK